jgi:hypothetical protein
MAEVMNAAGGDVIIFHSAFGLLYVPAARAGLPSRRNEKQGTAAPVVGAAVLQSATG